MRRADAFRRALSAFPSLLRVGVAEAVAYRAEFVVWLLTTTLPLVMLALWAEVARGGPVGSYTGADFTAYYLTTFIVRQLTGSWVAWEMNREIKEGLISMRLLRPLHPLVAYAAENMAVLPLRLTLSMPVAILVLIISGRQHLTHDPILLLLFPVAVAAGWALSFSVMAIIGALAFFIESTVLVFEIWFGIYSLCSGYLVPISLFPSWLAVLLRYLPFHAMLGLPVEIAIGKIGTAQALREVALAGGYVAATVFGAVALFQLGARRYSAYGA
jgi:ABC-2 type transport system permease protein